MRGCRARGIVIYREGPTEKSVVTFFATVRPYENHGQNDLFSDPLSL